VVLKSGTGEGAPGGGRVVGVSEDINRPSWRAESLAPDPAAG